MKRDRIPPRIAALPDDPADVADAVTYIECLLLARLDPYERAHAIGRGFITPCHDAEEGLDAMQRLQFWGTLLAFVLDVAEGSLGATGRDAIVQTLRNIPASQARAGVH